MATATSGDRVTRAIPTVKDVARAAGVSTATVSRVISGSRPVGDEIRLRVLEAVDSLGYVRNNQARNMRTRVSHTIALMLADLSNPTFVPVIEAIEEVVYSSGYTLLLCNSNESQEQEARHVAMLEHEHIAGLISIPVTLSGRNLDSLIARGVPIVCFDRRLRDQSLDTVIVDNAGGAMLAVQHLLSLGHRDVCIVASQVSLPGIERLAGYRRMLEMHNMPVREELILEGAHKEEPAYLAARQLLQRASPPTAFFVTNYLMVIGVLRAISERGLRIPADVSLVGFDDTPWAPYMSPPLTVVAQPTRELGRTAARMLIERMRHGNNAPARETVLEAHLIARESTAPPRRAG